MEIVQESEESFPTATSATSPPQRSLALSNRTMNCRQEEDSDEELIREISHSELPLETEDDDEPLLMFDGAGVS